MTEASAAALDLLESDLIFLDCEMTGGDWDKHDIIEIGAVRSRLPDLPLLGELSIKVAPRTTRGVNLDSLRIAGYSAKEWKSALAIEEALGQLQEFAEGTVLVGWATYNDLLFLQAAAGRVGLDGLMGDAYLELQDWAQQRLHYERTPGLQRVADQLKIVRDREHSAIEDALVTYEVFRLLWRYGPEDFDAALASLDWNSYAELTGPIALEAPHLEARRSELAGFVLTGTSREALLARRGSFRRD